MKKKGLFFIMIITLMLSSCGVPGAGPQTWLDRPLADTTFPIAPLIIQAHASDANGVSSFEFYVDDALLSSVEASGGRLGEASLEWTPIEAGIYTVKARAADMQGNFGSTTSVQIRVTGADLSTLTATPAPGTDLFTQTPTPASALPQCTIGELAAPLLVSPADGAMVAPDPLLSWAYPDTACHPHSYKIDISEDASFADISWGFGTLDFNETSRTWPLPAGQCYFWRASAYVPDVYGPFSAVWTFCIEGTPTPTPLNPTKTPLPPTSTPTATSSPVITRTPTVTSTPIPDTTPPSIISASVNPDTILTDGSGCPSYARTTNVQTRVVDIGGAVSRVWATWSIGAESGNLDLSAMGADNYAGMVGPVNTTGTLNIIVNAQDMAGNISHSSVLTVNVQNCIQ